MDINEQKAIILESLRKGQRIDHACALAGVTVDTHYLFSRDDQEYAVNCANAKYVDVERSVKFYRTMAKSRKSTKHEKMMAINWLYHHVMQDQPLLKQIGNDNSKRLLAQLFEVKDDND